MEEGIKKNKTMKKIIVILLFATTLLGCKKENEPEPKTPTPTPPATTSHSVRVTPSSWFTQVRINGTLQPSSNSTVSYTLNTGDSISVYDDGSDTTQLDSEGNVIGHTEGHVSVVIYVDNVKVYEVNCGCDANYTQTM